MCRHVAWVGPPRTLASVLLDPPWSLRRQAYQPRRQRHGLVNADGFGVGWYDPAARPEPARYRRSVPIWGDASLASFAPVVRAPALLGAVRSTTLGSPIEESATAPFTAGRWLLSHNGAVDPSLARTLLPPGVEPDTACDSAVLAAAVLARLAGGRPAPATLAALVPRIAALDPAARLNLLVTDGAAVTATAWGDSLCYLAGTGLAAGGVLVASEPLDEDPGWTDVPDRHLLHAGPGGITCTRMESAP